MCLLLETIKLNDGYLHHREDHEQRMNVSRNSLFGSNNQIWLDFEIPDAYKKGLYKCRVLYSDRITSVEFLPYTPRRISHLRLIENNTINYSFKYANRLMFESLPQCPPNEEYIIVKNGYLTDTTFSNILLFDGKYWHTPSTYLLNGTQRQRLLLEKRIVESKIRVEDLNKFESIRLINAMLELESSLDIKMSNVILHS